jgi:hypothetical protein
MLRSIILVFVGLTFTFTTSAQEVKKSEVPQGVVVSTQPSKPQIIAKVETPTAFATISSDRSMMAWKSISNIDDRKDDIRVFRNGKIETLSLPKAVFVDAFAFDCHGNLHVACEGNDNGVNAMFSLEDDSWVLKSFKEEDTLLRTSISGNSILRVVEAGMYEYTLSVIGEKGESVWKVDNGQGIYGANFSPNESLIAVRQLREIAVLSRASEKVSRYSRPTGDAVTNAGRLIKLSNNLVEASNGEKWQLPFINPEVEAPRMLRKKMSLPFNHAVPKLRASIHPGKVYVLSDTEIAIVRNKWQEYESGMLQRQLDGPPIYAWFTDFATAYVSIHDAETGQIKFQVKCDGSCVADLRVHESELDLVLRDQGNFSLKWLRYEYK